MPQRKLTEEECADLLKKEMLIRIAFNDQDFPYVLPFGYVYLDAEIYGITSPGRKTRIAETNPRVGFQIDSSQTTGPWEWRSITGEGQFEMVAREEIQRKAIDALEPLLSQAPDWWQNEIRPAVAAGIVKVWRIQPSRLNGIEYGQSVNHG